MKILQFLPPPIRPISETSNQDVFPQLVENGASQYLDFFNSDWDYNAAHLLEAKTQPQDFKGVSEALQPFDGEVKHCQPLGEDAVFQPVEGEERELQLPDGEVRDLQLPEDDDKPQAMGCKSTELPVSNSEGKKLQSLDGLVQELKPLDDKTRDLGPLESKTQVDLESADKFGRTKNLQPSFFARWQLTLVAESGQNPRDGHVLISGPELIPDSLPILEMQEPGHLKQFEILQSVEETESLKISDEHDLSGDHSAGETKMSHMKAFDSLIVADKPLVDAKTAKSYVALRYSDGRDVVFGNLSCVQTVASLQKCSFSQQEDIMEKHQEAAGIYSVSYADILKRGLNLNDDEEPSSGATHLELPQILDTTSVEDSRLPDWPDIVERGLRDAGNSATEFEQNPRAGHVLNSSGELIPESLQPHSDLYSGDAPHSTQLPTHAAGKKKKQSATQRRVQAAILLLHFLAQRIPLSRNLLRMCVFRM
ncbi:hypothetical protein Nepgr_014333 [Nepenthes gracilis]|uniref:Uncharacterized protein n=1 Tax=Nepenthes gracilis TaxID=150966 RepID=A0AAD3XPE4_NEPGR|nr:hypothetical protein Nepgr_014333 [Nepenthes gracilis]